MESKLTKLIQIRCAQLSSPKNGSKRYLLSLSVLRCSPDVLEGSACSERFFPPAGQSDNTACSAPLTEHGSVGWFCRYTIHSLRFSLWLPGSGSRPCQTCQWQSLQEAVGSPKITGLEPGTEATRAKAKLRIVSRSL